MNPVAALCTLNHLRVLVVVVVVVAFEADSAEIAFFVERSAVGTKILLVVPGQVPRLSRCYTAAFTPNARHAHPGHVAVHRFRVSWSQAGRVV